MIIFKLINIYSTFLYDNSVVCALYKRMLKHKLPSYVELRQQQTKQYRWLLLLPLGDQSIDA